MTEHPTENGRLRDAKRRAAAIADERSRENVGLRAEIERLRASLEQAIDLIASGRSCFIAGTEEDMRWDKRRTVFVKRVRDDEQRGGQ